MINRYPYITATLVATLLAIVVWLCMPKYYTAITKLSDEYKETDLALGFNAIRAYIRDATGSANSGLNNMEIYCKVLKTDDFARCISHKQVPRKGITYGEYLCEKDTIEAVKESINYNYSSKQTTLSVSFTDRDPIVAAQMLDSTTVQLQQIIINYRQENARVALRNATLNLNTTKEKYKVAQTRYNAFADSHSNLSAPSAKQKEEELSKESKHAYALYKKATEEYVRQQALKQRAYLSFAVIQNNSVPQKPDTHLIGYLLSFIILALLITYIIQRRKSIDLKAVSFQQLTHYFSPWTLTIGIWTIILGLYYLLDTDLYPITRQFYYCFIIWIPIFCVCSFLSYKLTDCFEYNNNTEFNKNVFSFFLIISIIITPLYVYRVYEIVSMFSADDLMENVRILAVNGEGQGFLGQSAILNQALLITALWAYPRIPLWQVVITVIACFLNSVAIMEKGTMFFVFICIIFVLHHKKTIKLRTIVIAGLLLIGFFYIFNLQRAGVDSDYSDDESIIDFIAMYVLSPPVAFCQLMPEITPQFGTNTFGPIYHFMIRFGVDGIVEKLKTQEFVWVPIPTNVYTIFQPFYIDFGYKGIAFFSALYGIICGFLYRLYTKNYTVGCCLYTFIVYVLILQFYQENVFLSLATVIEFAILVYLMTQQHIKIGVRTI